jgi:hypothetical protein
MSSSGVAPEATLERDIAVAPTSSSVYAESAIFKFHATVEEVAKAQLHDVFLIVQPALTRAVKAIFVIKFDEDNWISHYKSYLGPSMQEFAVDDGRPFDMCVRSAQIVMVQCLRHMLNASAAES